MNLVEDHYIAVLPALAGLNSPKIESILGLFFFLDAHVRARARYAHEGWILSGHDRHR